VPKVVVLGIDGLGQQSVQKWGAELPNLTQMQADGIWGKLESVIPPSTPVVWTCSQTGRNPGAFGFWDWTFRDSYAYGHFKPASADQIQPDPLYRLLAKRGMKSAIINVPVTWPPPRVPGGYAVSSLPTAPGQGYTWPASLNKEIEGLLGGEYVFDVSLAEQDKNQELFMEEIYRIDEQRVKLLKHFISKKQCDYILTVMPGLDRLMHFFYRCLENDSNPKYRAALINYYRHIDSKIGEIRALLDDETVLLIHSCHAAQKLDGLVNLNEWLIKEGYMVLEEYPPGLTCFENLKVDWKKTRAWAKGNVGQLYINLKGREAGGIVDPSGYDALLEEIGAGLKKIAGEKESPLETRVYKRGDIHSGPLASYGPDLFVTFDGYRWHTSDAVGSSQLYSGPVMPGPEYGGHGCKGYFCLAGPGIEAGGEKQDISLLDLAPTILFILGEPVPVEMEGKPIITKPVFDEEKAVRERLNMLGY